MKYFSNCTTLEEVKKLYKELAKANHPDRGGDTATMQAINAEYTRAINNVVSGNYSRQYTQEEAESEILNAKAYAEAIQAIINLQGINIELCGGWIWVSGDTYQHRKIFKDHGFYFASVKKQWYFRSAEYKTNNKKSMSMPEIRRKYGSQQITTFTYKFLSQ